MSADVPVTKDPDGQAPIPTAWRAALAGAASAIGRGDYQAVASMAAIRPISVPLAEAIASNIRDYGVSLTDLPEESWLTSVCQWMGGYWDVLVDLFSIEEGASDLVLVVRVYEVGAEYSFEIQAVHVP